MPFGSKVWLETNQSGGVSIHKSTLSPGRLNGDRSVSATRANAASPVSVVACRQALGPGRRAVWEM
jgi:hypothetical protein